MAFVATPHGVKVALEGSQGGIPVVNVFHVKAPGEVAIGVLNEILDVFVAWVEDNWLASLSGTYTLLAIRCKDISTSDGIEVVHNYTSGNTGGAGGAATAANAAMCITWRTLYTGRSFRGRTYVGALPASQQHDAHHMETTYAAAFADYAMNLIEALQTAGYVLCVLSKVANGVARVTGILTEIISVIVDTKIDSQRRRTAN